jgi:hypothetical protein
MTCNCNDQFKCKTLRCRVLACIKYRNLTDAEVDRRLAKKLNKKKCRDFIGQLRRGEKKGVRSKALEALAEILGTRLEYLRLIDDDHNLEFGYMKFRPAVNSTMPRQPPSDRFLLEEKERLDETRREMEEEARKPDFQARLNIPQDEPVDIEDPNTAYYDPSREADQWGELYDDDEEDPTPATNRQRPLLVPIPDNPFRLAARNDRQKHPESRRLSIFATQIEDGEWTARSTDRTMQAQPIIRRTEYDRLYGFACPVDCPIPWLAGGGMLFVEHATHLRTGSLILTFQPVDQPAIAKCHAPTRGRIVNDVELRERLGLPDLDATKTFRLGVWHYRGRHSDLDAIRVARLDARDGEEDLMMYDQILFAVISVIVPG